MPLKKKAKNFSEALLKKVFEKKADLNDLTENHVIKSINHVNLQYPVLKLQAELWNYVKPG